MTVGGKGPLLQMPQRAGVLKGAEGSRQQLFGEEEDDDDGGGGGGRRARVGHRG